MNPSGNLLKKRYLIIAIIAIVVIGGFAALIATNKFSASTYYFQNWSSGTLVNATPSTINPNTGQKTTIKTQITVSGQYRLIVQNRSLQTVKEIAYFSKAGARTDTWDGRDSTGKILAADTYRVILQKRNWNYKITDLGYAAVLVQSNIAAGGNTDRGTGGNTGGNTNGGNTNGGTGGNTDNGGNTNNGGTDSGAIGNLVTTLGQKYEGNGANNFPVRDQAYALCFQAEKTGTATSFEIQWKGKGSYAGGNGGTYRVTLVKQNSSHFPDMNQKLGSVANVAPGSYENNLSIPISGASLTAGAYYALVVENTSSSPTSNFSSVNNLQTRVKAWDGIGGLAGYPSNGQWKAWVNMENSWAGGVQTWGTNTGNTPPVITHYSDGSITGMAYYWANYPGSTISSSNVVGEYIHWTGETVSINKIGVPVHDMSGTLTFHLATASGQNLASGTMTGGGTGTAPQWAYSSTFTPVTLQKGTDYRLWFTCSGSAKTFIIIGDTGSWPSYGWGGTSSYAFSGSTSSKSFDFSGSPIDGTRGDMSFDLVKAN